MKTVKRFTYRGDPTEEWSNEYALTLATPASRAGWITAADALMAAEKPLYRSGSTIVKVYGYDSDDEDAIAVFTYDSDSGDFTAVAGTLVVGTDLPIAGDQAAWIRWKTERLTSKGKPIYLRKFYHGLTTSPGAPDSPSTTWRTNAATFATALRTGSNALIGAIRGQGHSPDPLISSAAATFMTTRTLKRRGKRPPTSP